MCQCPGGQLGMQCPSPIQLNCPPMQCPPPPPCNPFPTLGTLMPLGGSQGLAQFTLPTLPPLGGSPFAPTSTPLPLAVTPPVNGQESLVPIQSNQYDPASQQQQQQQQFQQQQQPQQEQIQPQQLQPQQPPQQVFQENSLQHPQEFQAAPPAPAPAQVSVQPSVHFAETIPVDATTRVTTLPSEAYIEADQPEESIKEDGSSENFLPLYENQPNKPSFDGFRQPVRRAQAAQAAQAAQPAANGKPEVFTDKCNDERLKRIIEQNVDSNPSSSKRKIQKAATDEIGGLFDVICSSHDFSYLANTQVFCEAGNDDVTCFAFLHSLIQ
uniref:EGF-like domain-containing protein n=1 Tax=Haemonchus contortus TaxID=6289 RepID=A0A7I5ECY2_HAECO